MLAAGEASPTILRPQRSSCRGRPPIPSSTSRKARSRSPSFPSRARKLSSQFLGPDEFFGEGCLAGQTRRMATVNGHDGLRHHAAGEGGHRPRDSMTSRPFPRCSWPIFWRARSASKRISSTSCSTRAKSGWPELLLLLANFGKEGKPEPIIAKISQETLAEMIGTTRSRVSFFMNKFRKLGFIDYNGRSKSTARC